MQVSDDLRAQASIAYAKAAQSKTADWPAVQVVVDLVANAVFVDGVKAAILVVANHGNTSSDLPDLARVSEDLIALLPQGGD